MPACASAADAIRSVDVDGAAPELMDATLRMLMLLDRPKDIPAMASLIEKEILPVPPTDIALRSATADRRKQQSK